MLALVLALSLVPCTQHKLLECLNLPVRVSITSGSASPVMLALVLALSLVPFGPGLSTLFFKQATLPSQSGHFPKRCCTGRRTDQEPQKSSHRKKSPGDPSIRQSARYLSLSMIGRLSVDRFYTRLWCSRWSKCNFIEQTRALKIWKYPGRGIWDGGYKVLRRGIKTPT